MGSSASSCVGVVCIDEGELDLASWGFVLLVGCVCVGNRGRIGSWLLASKGSVHGSM